MFLIAWLLSLIGPRIALAYLWLFTTWVDRAYDGLWVAILGFMFLPWSTLAFVLIWQAGGLGLLGWLVVGVGFFADIGGYASSAFRGR